jgi:hypothetical protein
MPALDASQDRLWSSVIRHAENIGDRGFRKWLATKTFPPPDGNLNGRNFWFRSTYERWKSDVVAGQYSQQRRPPIAVVVRGRGKQRRPRAPV